MKTRKAIKDPYGERSLYVIEFGRENWDDDECEPYRGENGDEHFVFRSYKKAVETLERLQRELHLICQALESEGVEKSFFFGKYYRIALYGRAD